MSSSTGGADPNRSRPALEVLYEPETNGVDKKAEVDIIAVHGLGSNVDFSWTWKDGEKHVHWLQDKSMLPERVPNSRIIAYNYQSRWHVDAPRIRLSLCGEELIHSIDSFRAESSDRPIIFVCHSLGGNVVVEGLLYAHKYEKYSHVLDKVAGLVFLGTPFRGTKWQPFLDAIACFMQPNGSDRGITKELGFDDPYLTDNLHRFCRLVNRSSTPVSCFSECYETNYGRRLGLPLIKGIAVKQESAWIPGFDRHILQADHLKINKYSGPNDRSFIAVSTVISNMCKETESVIRRRQNPKPIIVDRNDILRENPEATSCLRDLFLTDPFEDKEEMKVKKGDRSPETCEWLLGTEVLTIWLGSGLVGTEMDQVISNVLWLHGHPGTGKSTTAIFLSEQLPKDFAATDGKMLAYFFCDSSNTSRSTATSVIRGLLLQLIQQHSWLLRYILPKYDGERGKKLFDSAEALWTILLDMAKDAETGRKYCIIDALDECDEQSQKFLLDKLRQLNGPNGTLNLRVLVFSRPYPEISRYLQKCTNRDLASFQQRKDDLDHFINDKVGYLAGLNKYPDELKEKVVHSLQCKAEGTFLWVGMACKDLEDVFAKDVLNALDQMPEGLHKLYENLLDKAVSRKRASKNTIQQIIGFVAVCHRPLSVLELSDACRLHQNQNEDTRRRYMCDEIASCRQLVVIRDEKVVVLLHQSVKDFIFSPGTSYHIDECETHANLAYRCIDALIEAFHMQKGPEDLHGFLDYAIGDWAYHAGKAGRSFRISDSQKEFFSVDSPCLKHWQGLKRKGKSNILHVAAEYDIVVILEYILGQSGNGVDLELKDDDGDTPLVVANLCQNLDAMACLLKHGAELTWSTVDFAALMARLGTGRGVTLQHLSDLFRSHISEEFVEAAAKNRGPDAMRIVLDIKGNHIITEKVLKVAAANENPGVLKLLFDRCGDQIIITEEIVRVAAANNDPGVLELLLDRKGDQVTITEEIVKVAVANANLKVLELLFDYDEEETLASITEEALFLIASWGYACMFRMRYPQLQFPDNIRDIADFRDAARSGDIACIKRLLDQGINPDIKDPMGRTALSDAVLFGYVEVVDVLARLADVNVNSINKYGSTALHSAIFGENGRMVAILLEAGADPDIPDEDGRTPITYARRWRRNPRILEMLERASRSSTSNTHLEPSGDLMLLDEL